jgi:hypothetical protein
MTEFGETTLNNILGALESVKVPSLKKQTKVEIAILEHYHAIKVDGVLKIASSSDDIIGCLTEVLAPLGVDLTQVSFDDSDLSGFEEFQR